MRKTEDAGVQQRGVYVLALAAPSGGGRRTRPGASRARAPAGPTPPTGRFQERSRRGLGEGRALQVPRHLAGEGGGGRWVRAGWRALLTGFVRISAGLSHTHSAAPQCQSRAISGCCSRVLSGAPHLLHRNCDCRAGAFCHGCLSPRPAPPGATQREMRAAPARALSPRPTTTTAASPCPAARRAATAAARSARSEDRGESGTIGLPV